MISYFGNCSSPWESLVLFEAAKEGLVATVVNRLTEDERREIASGSIFIWDERRSSIRRWTDGITWSNSRVIGDFLEYRELLPGANGDERPSRFTVKAYGLCKRTLCLAASDDPDEPKLRLVSYCSKRDAMSGGLPLPSEDPKFQSIVKRLEAIYGTQATLRQNGFYKLAGVFRRNPSPTRDRRKSRRAQGPVVKTSFNPFAVPSEPHYASDMDSESSGNMTELSSRPAMPQNELTRPEYPATYGPYATPVLPAVPEEQTRPSSDLIGRVLNDNTLRRGRDCSGTSKPPTPIPTEGTYGHDNMHLGLLRSRLSRLCEDGQTPPNVLILPDPQHRIRTGRRNSEDLRLLDKLDNCVNAFY